MEPNYVKADSGNLPKVDAIMIGLFFKNNPDFYAAELKNVKTALASRESYGDDAIGYVQLRRESGICTLKCKIYPENKVRAKSYSITMIVDEDKSQVISCECHDCAASAGGCKHAVAFLMWTHRRSEEPSCTSVECYWKKSTLSRVGTTMKFITVEQLTKKQTPHPSTSSFSSTELLSEFFQEAKRRKIEDCELVKYQYDHKFTDIKQFSLHHFLLSNREIINKEVNKFVEMMTEMININIVNAVEQSTRQQNKSYLWYELRYGRITASKAYEVSRCQTADGSLVAAIMGAKVPDTSAMKRGRILESAVRKAVEQKLKRKFKTCGLFLSTEYPMIAASPDGICQDAVLEIKCPTSEKNKINYIKNNVICAKYFAQIQLQMYVSNRKKCYFCIGHPDFESTKNVDILLVPYENEYVCNLLNNLASFWKSNIFPLLSRSTNID